MTANFNYVNFHCECPNCREELNDFQTQSGKTLNGALVEPWTVTDFYSYCNGCGCWVDYSCITTVNVTELLFLRNLVQQAEFLLSAVGIPENSELYDLKNQLTDNIQNYSLHIKRDKSAWINNYMMTYKKMAENTKVSWKGRASGYSDYEDQKNTITHKRGMLSQMIKGEL